MKTPTEFEGSEGGAVASNDVLGAWPELPNGLVLVQQNPDCAVDLNSASRTYGWLFIRGTEAGQWVTHRKLESWEIMQAEDQRDYGIVHQGTKLRAG